MKKSAQFYLANLASDMARCVASLRNGDERQYQQSLQLAMDTLHHIDRDSHAHQEGLQLIKELKEIEATKDFHVFTERVNAIATQYSPLLQ